MENLKNLEKLDLSENFIYEIKGLENLTNLQELYMSDHPIREDERHLLKKEAQEVVKYCQEKASKQKKAIEGNKGVGKLEKATKQFLKI